MTYRVLLLALSCTSFLAPGVARAQEATRGAARPNILFLLSDDHRWDQLGCAGHAIVKTPQLDALAASGTRFSRAFVTTSICAASRATILTGLYERTHGYTFRTRPIARAHCDRSYPQLLKESGYRTGFIGKFGVRVPRGTPARWFDVFEPKGANPYFKKQKDGSRRHLTEILGDRAVAFLEAQPRDRPFSLSVSFNAVHAEDGDKLNHYPWPVASDGMYADVEIPAPRLAASSIFEAHPAFLANSLNRQRYFWRWDTPEKYDKNMRAYYRMMSGMDRVIGRVLKTVADLGFADNTIVIFMGDNGYYMAQRGFAGKWSHYDESLRVPLIIRDPRVAAVHRGRVEDKIALNVDIAATILDYAGVSPPEQYQGESLAGLVRANAPAIWREDFFCEHLMHLPPKGVNDGGIPKWEGVRGLRWTYACYFEQEPPYEYLHDLEDDPDQLQNLAARPEHADRLRVMRERTRALRDQYGGAWSLDKYPLARPVRNPRPPKNPVEQAKRRKE